MFTITLVAVAAAVAAWLRPMPEAKPAASQAPNFNAAQISDAKSKVCQAYTAVHRATGANATRNLGSEPTAQLAVTTNMRLIYVAGSAYLLTVLNDEAATPGELAAVVGKVARLFQSLTIEGSVADPSVEAYNEVNQAGETIQNLCK